MPRASLNPLSYVRMPVSPDRTSPDRTPGSSPGSSPSSSPTHAFLSARRGHGSVAMQPTAMQQPALRPRQSNLLPRTASPGPLVRPRHHFAVDPAIARPSRPAAAQADTADLPKIKQGLDRWAQGAKAETLPPQRLEGPVLVFQEPREQSIDTARAAVFKAARSNAPNLQIRYLQATGLPSEALGELRGLEHLALKSSLCRKLPEFTPNLATLSTLELKGNLELDSLPENIWALKELKTIDIRDSPLLESLPASIGALNQLTTLKLHGTGIRELPSTLLGMSGSLQTLEISSPGAAPTSGLKTLPENIGDFQSLTTLKLSNHNGLTELPASLGKLSKLKTLDLTYCGQLTTLPDLSKLSNLKTLNLYGCLNLNPKQLQQTLAQLPADCMITMPGGRQQLAAPRQASPQRRPTAASTSSPHQSPPRLPEAAAAQQQTLGGWKDQLKPFKAKGERGADRLNIWLGALLDKHDGPDVKQKIQAVVDAAAQSPDFRATLFAFAAENVVVPRNAFGVRQPGRATVTNTNVHEVHNRLLAHQVTGPQLNARQAASNLKELALNEKSPFARELMILAFERPASPGRAESPPAAVPLVLAAYVQAHDREHKKILEARHALESRQGGRSSPDDAAAHAAALQVNDALLRGRHVAVAKQLVNAIDPRLFKP